MGHQNTGQGRFQADVHRLLTTVMQREIDDPRLIAVGVTRLEFPTRNEYIRVFVHSMNEGDTQGCIERLNRLAPRLSHALRRAMPKRRIPTLEFHWDDVFDASGDVLDILNKLDKA
ncbi:MAG: ribosome-binding factor A [Mariprofundaceae bacterium]